jgi:hypothetical protein
MNGLPVIGTITNSGWNMIAEDTTVSSMLYFDEIRLSDSIRNDEWPPRHLVETTESFVDWFRRTRKGDTELLGLDEVQYSGLTTSGLIPYGFRLKDSDFDIASRLDTATFLTLSGFLPMDYFEV